MARPEPFGPTPLTTRSRRHAVGGQQRREANRRTLLKLVDVLSIAPSIRQPEASKPSGGVAVLRVSSWSPFESGLWHPYHTGSRQWVNQRSYEVGSGTCQDKLWTNACPSTVNLRKN